ncbi:hypothetical protein G6550_16000 [Azonexus fungiphilus]|nr:hypothetical protein [Azonexus fungiphilus]
MRRWLSIFLLIILPIQISWAVAATYCQHEIGAAQHFGHHEHKHQADDSAKSANGSVASVDNDCAACHAGSVAALTGISSSLPVAGIVADHPWSAYFLTSPPGEQPERPNWSISA